MMSASWNFSSEPNRSIDVRSTMATWGIPFPGYGNLQISHNALSGSIY